jgi:hypothetical protein
MYLVEALFLVVSPMYASMWHPTTVNVLPVLEKVYLDPLKSQCHWSGTIFPDVAL